MVTLKKEVKLVGNGLMKNKPCEVTLFPSNSGQIRYFVKDKDSFTADVDNVISTDHCVVLGTKKVRAMLTEHLSAALAFCHIDSVDICMTEEEVPILDGSAKPYIDAMWADGFQQQDAPRRYIEIKETIEIRNDEKGSVVRIKPAEEFSYDIMVDFNSRVLGVQHAVWNPSVVYAEEIGVCRTFVFFHEIEFLFKNGLVKGGDVDNAIVIVEHPVTTEQVENMSRCTGSFLPVDVIHSFCSSSFFICSCIFCKISAAAGTAE